MSVVQVDTPGYGKQILVVSGALARSGTFREEWSMDFDEPETWIARVRAQAPGVDLFHFAQRLPYSRPRHPYAFEWDNVAAIPITSREHWEEHQIHRNVRNKLRKGEKAGLSVRVLDFDDAWFRGIKEIQDESPLRQGTPFSHYRKDLETVRREHSTYLDGSTAIGAFFGEEMVGYLKIVPAGRFARVMGLLTKSCHSDKAPMNALFGKAVEVCAARGFGFLVYGRYQYGKGGSQSLQALKHTSGFEHILLPRYYVPLTARGRFALRIGFHQGIKEVLPVWFVQGYLKARKNFYETRLKLKERMESRTVSEPARSL